MGVPLYVLCNTLKISNSTDFDTEEGPKYLLFDDIEQFTQFQVGHYYNIRLLNVKLYTHKFVVDKQFVVVVGLWRGWGRTECGRGGVQ